MGQDATLADIALKPISEIARDQGLDESEVELYGTYKAKVSLRALERLKDRPNGRYIIVTSITPTPLGEGKTTTAIGLAMGMNRMGYKTAVCLPQASLGPVFGIKGGAAGGGLARISPTEAVNLHLTGDTHAVAMAHNLLAAFLDNSLFHGNLLDLDPFSIVWPRVVDTNDRALRQVMIGLGGKQNGIPRESGFEMVAGSEVMSILALATGAGEAAALRNLRARLGRIVVATTRNGKLVTADDLRVAGAMAVLLKDALKPNLLQTVERTPVYVHTGPFGHTGQGGNSILADQLASKTSDFVLAEAGFGSDLGLEKLLNIKCRYSGLVPDAVVMVATLRALKMHGGVGRVETGRPIPAELARENNPALEKGCANLAKHIENAALFGLPVIVALNRFPGDSDRELAQVEQIARQAGAEGAYVSEAFTRGGAGAISLSEGVVRAARKPSTFRFLYPEALPIRDKIERVATQIYGAEGVDLSPAAEAKCELYAGLGYDKLPVCMAKTHLSLSHDEKLRGRPRGFRVPVRDIRLAAGAGYLSALCGDPRAMPGLPTDPAGAHIDLDEQGRVVGLY